MNQREQERERIERLRGWIIYILYKSRPSHLELDSLQRLLDKRNLPVTRRRLAEELDYLRSLRFIRISLGSTRSELDETTQTRVVQRYADADRAEAEPVCACLTAAGINFQEAFEENITGIARVD